MARARHGAEAHPLCVGDRYQQLQGQEGSTEPNEYAAGRIPGSVLNPLQKFDPEALPRVPGKRVVLSCHSGRRSLIALALAQKAGRGDVHAHYPGGFQEWANAGEEVEV
jgi:rhodanese-related sulfurtransferase